VVPLFVIGNPPGSGPIDPLNMTYGDYLTWLEKYYGGLSDAVTAIKCGTPSPNPTTVVLNCLSFMWSHLPDPLPKVLDAASSVIGCASVANLNLTAVGSCAGGMKLIIFVIHQALLHEPTGVGQTFLNQRMPLPGG
jgi:hypothetical protein